jgi:hypothetical protein
MIEDRIVYREETSKWYKSGEEFKTPGVVADSYPEAFQMLFGRSPSIPPPVRSERKSLVLL